MVNSSQAKEEDQKKLDKVKNYIKHTAGTTLVIKPDSLELQAFVDASHAVHVDGFGHTGVILCLGGAPIWLRSEKYLGGCRGRPIKVRGVL